MKTTVCDVAIVGAGLAGIAAALAARRAGATVVLLERGDGAGGRVRSAVVRERLVERGPHSFNGRHLALWRLLDGLSLTDAAQPLPGAPRRHLARFGRLHGIRPSPLTLLSTGALTFGEKLALLRALRMKPSVQGAPDESLHAFAARHFGESFASEPFTAFIHGVFGTAPKALLARGAFPELVHAERTHGSVLKGLRAQPASGRPGVFTLAGGLGRIGQQAQKLFDVRLRAQVEPLERVDGRWEVRAEGQRVVATSAILATEPSAAARLVPSLRAPLEAMGSVALTVVHWEGEHAKLPDGFGYLACPSERLNALGTLFSHGPGPRRFSSFFRGVDADDATLGRQLAEDVQRLTGGSVDEVVHIERWREAVFQPTAAALAARDGLRGAVPQGLWLAGAHLGAGAMKDAAASGFEAGEAAAASALAKGRKDAA